MWCPKESGIPFSLKDPEAGWGGMGWRPRTCWVSSRWGGAGQGWRWGSVPQAWAQGLPPASTSSHYQGSPGTTRS
jgi:hypothetical protein